MAIQSGEVARMGVSLISAFLTDAFRSALRASPLASNVRPINRMQKKIRISIVVSLMLFPAHALACVAGYFAPAFLDVTDPVIGIGMFLLVTATFINLKRKQYINALVVPLIYMAVSYYGHWNYVGDCGYEIVSLNRMAAIIAFTWAVYELAIFYWVRRNKIA